MIYTAGRRSAPFCVEKGYEVKKVPALLVRLKKLLFDETLTCAACGAELYGGSRFCPHCLQTLPFNGGNICAKCGRAAAEAVPACLECKADMPAFRAARSAFRYEGEIVRLVKRFKTGGRHLAGAFAEAMLPLFSREFADTDFLACVPMTEKAVKKRGYNQSALLAAELSARTGVPFEAELLVKTRETEAQKTLSRRERAENLGGSFRVHERAKCRGKKILLVDDVMTTGATANALAAALLRAGARSVYLLTAASVPQAVRGGKEQGQRG